MSTREKQQLTRAKAIWSDEYLTFLEENFDSIFEKIYMKQFVDQVFLSHETRIGKEEFVEAIVG